MNTGSRAYPAFVLALALGCMAVVLFAPPILADGDTFLHIAAGRWMLEHRAVLHSDPFSLTMAGHPWVAHEWLSELLMALAWRLGGLPLLLLPFALSMAAAVLLLGAGFRRWLAPLPAGLLLLGAVNCVMPSLLARPHLLVLPLMAGWALALLVARSQGRAPRLALALLLVPWVNLHGSFFVGIAFATALAGEAWLLGAGRRWPIARDWGLFLLACVAAALVSPHGLAGLLMPFRLLAVPALASVGEWSATDFSHPQPMLFLLLGLLYVGLVYGPRLPRLRVALLLALIYTALQHSRNQLLLGVFGLLLLAEPLAHALPDAAAAAPAPRLRPPVWAGFAALALALFVLRTQLPSSLGDAPTRPISALAHLPPGLAAQPVLNDYSFGAWLIFRGIHPYIDSRVEVYGNDALRAYQRMVSPDHARLQAALAAHHIAWTLFAAHSPAAQMMDLLPGWKRLYADATAVVHVRTGD